MKTSIAAILFVMISGCELTLHPFHTDKELVFDHNLIGTWQSQNSKRILKFNHSEKKSYWMTVAPDNDTESILRAHLVKAHGHLFLDMQLKANEVSKAHQGYIILGHKIMRVEQIQPELHLRALDYNWLEKHLKSNPLAIAHEQTKNGIVLTAPTKELQIFFAQHVETKGAYGKVEKHRRLPAHPKP